MPIRQIFALFCACGFALVAAPVMADEVKPKPSDGPDQRICESQTIVGTRLAKRRVCGTRAEWEEKRRLDKDAIDQAQRSPCMITGTSSTGKASC